MELFEKLWRKESKGEVFEGIDKLKAKAWMYTGWRLAIEDMGNSPKNVEHSDYGETPTDNTTKATTCPKCKCDDIRHERFSIYKCRGCLHEWPDKQ